MSDMQLHAAHADATSLRQVRLEERMLAILRSGGTRSALRASVEEYADQLRRQGVSPEAAVAIVRRVAMRAWPASAADSDTYFVGDSPADRMAMIVRWCDKQRLRAD